MRRGDVGQNLHPTGGGRPWVSQICYNNYPSRSAHACCHVATLRVATTLTLPSVGSSKPRALVSRSTHNQTCTKPTGSVSSVCSDTQQSHSHTAPCEPPFLNVMQHLPTLLWHKQPPAVGNEHQRCLAHTGDLAVQCCSTVIPRKRVTDAG
jgi:hypothetical protein